MRRAEQAAILGLSIAMVIVPGSLALALVEQARASLIAPQRIQYLKQQPPADTAGGLEASLSYRVSEVSGSNPMVPRVFLARLPSYLGELTAAHRKAVFAGTVLPLVLRVNEILFEDRQRLLSVRSRTNDGSPIEDWELQWSLRMARIYRTGQPESIEAVRWDMLLQRVDIVPPSLVIAQAANESGWGTSRFAQEGNAIFGQWIFGDGPGMVPANRPRGLDHKVRSFNFLIESVLGYAQNLNTHEAYEDFRLMRAAGRAAGAVPAGAALAATLVNYSVRGEAYVEDIEGIIRTNGFGPLDEAQLITPRGLSAQ